MFFHKDNFKKYLGEDQANLMAKVANKVVNDQGRVAFGRSFTDGECKNFSTVQSKTDTHVGIIIGLSEMGAFEPSKVEVLVDAPTREDEVRAMSERMRLLELENLQLRGKT